MKFPFDYDPETGIKKSIQFDMHHSGCDSIVTEQDERIKNAIYEENARLLKEEPNTKNSLGLLGSIPLEEWLDIHKNYPELRHMKGADKKLFWRTFFQEKENRKFLSNKKLLRTHT